MSKKKDRARDDEDQPFGGVLTGSLVQQLQRIQRNREEARQDREEREEAVELGISVWQMRRERYEADNKPVVVDLASIQAEELKWLWPARIPLGKITLFSGDPGLGKSYVALDIAARVTNGAEWPGEEEGVMGREEEGEKEVDQNAKHSSLSTETCSSIENSENALPVKAPALSDESNVAGVLILSAEDDTADTIRPRLERLGANLDNIKILCGVKNDGEYESFSIPRDIGHLEKAVRNMKNCRLVIIDPLSSYLDNMGGNSLSSVRKALDPLRDLAERCGVAVILINHLNKKSGAAIHRSAGSISIVGIARTVWGFTYCKHDQTRRLMVPLKNNLSNDSEGLVYSITSENGLVWDDEPIEIRADEAFGNQEKLRGRNPNALPRAMNWLRYKLSSGEPVPQTTIEADAKEAEISGRTLFRAKKKLGVEVRLDHNAGKWFWKLQKTIVETSVTF